ncbi:MAG TPA: arsenate reductase (glutaredoxin) [Gammaproteobacteria bacterium]|nr:arsenate reductase (glutaredoxin) [Gammaproteobacteria bacterium]
MDVTIYHNPRCSKSRETLKLLRERGIEPRIVDYLKQVPGRSELKMILKLLGLSPRELMRTKEKLYKELGLNDPGLSDAALIQAMLDNPSLIERPIVLAQGKAALGRPPEQVLEIL